MEANRAVENYKLKRYINKKKVRTSKRASREKRKAKRKRKNTNRSPSGFVKPTLISNELANFLNKPIGTEMARTEVTREINGYIRLHSLQENLHCQKGWQHDHRHQNHRSRHRHNRLHYFGAIHILRKHIYNLPQNFVKSSPYFCPM